MATAAPPQGVAVGGLPLLGLGAAAALLQNQSFKQLAVARASMPAAQLPGIGVKSGLA